MANPWDNDPVVGNAPDPVVGSNPWDNDPVVGVDVPSEFATKPDGETTVLGSAFEFGKGIPRGFLHSFATAAEGIGQLADTATDFVGLENLIDSGDDNELIRLARAGQEKIDHTLGADAAYRDQWTTKFGDAIGSLASFFTPALGAKLLGGAGKLTKAVEVGGAFTLATGLGAGEASQRMERAREQGLDVTMGDEDKAILGGSLIGLTELAPVSKILKGLKRDDLFDEAGELLPLAKTWLPRVKTAVGSGTVEAVQEVSAGFMQDALEKNLYNPNLQHFQSAWDELTLGGAAGFTADLVLNSMIGRRAKGITDQQVAKEKEIRAQESDRMARWATSFDPVDRRAIETVLPDGTPVLKALPHLPPEPADPNDPAGVVRSLAKQHEEQLAENFPLNTMFSSTEQADDGTATPTPIVRDQDGNQYGPEFKTVEEAAMFAGAMNEIIIDRSIDQQVDLALDQSGAGYSPGDRLSLKLFGRRLFHPDSNTFTEQQINAAAGTVLENGYAHEALSVEEAREQGVTLPNLTAVQRANYYRQKAGRPTSKTFTVQEARKILKDDFNRMQDYTLYQTGANEQFRGIKDGDTVTVQSNLGTVVTDRPRTLEEMETAPDEMERTKFESLADAKRYAAKLNAKAAQGSVLQADIGLDSFKPEDQTPENSARWDQRLKDELRKKNITSDLNSPEVRAVAQMVTGSKGRGKTAVSDMSAGEKALLYHKLRGIPSLEKPSPLPVYGLRPYTPAHYQAAKKAALSLASDPDSTFDDKSMPSHQELVKQAGPLTEAAHARLLKDIAADTALRDEIRTQQETEQRRSDNEKRILKAREGEKKRVAKAVKKVMGKYGLQRVATKILDYSRQAKFDDAGNVVIGEETGRRNSEGSYNRRLDAIFLHVETLKRNDSYVKLRKEGATQEELDEHLESLAISTLNHEVLHALRQADLFTQKEWEMLEKLAMKRKRPDRNMSYTQDAQERYPDLTPVGQMEEAIAELIRHGLNGTISIGGPQKSLMKRVLEFLKGIIGLKAEGFETFDDLISGLRTGEIAEREDGVIRTLRDTERVQTAVPSRGIRAPEGEVAPARAASQAGDEQSQPDFAEARMWHGSPHRFDEFKRDAIGTGAGVQAQGYGLYFTARRDFAEPYAQMEGNREFGVEYNPSSNLYLVEIPDDVLEKFLYQDKPLHEQQRVMDIFEQAAGDGDGVARAVLDRLAKEQKTFGKNYINGDSLIHEYLPDALAKEKDGWVSLGKPEQVSDYLLSLDIRGNLYGISQNTKAGFIGPLVEALRGNNEVSFNAVVFDANDVRIVEHNGTPLPQSDVVDARSGEGLPILPRVPDKLDPAAQYLQPIGDVEQGIIDLMERTDNNPTSRQLANLKGAPRPRTRTLKSGRKVRDNRDMEVRPTTLKELRKMMKTTLENEEYREWYNHFGEGISKLVGEANVSEASVIFGITSAQNSVEQNLADTLTVMATAREVDPVQQRDQFIKAIRNKKRPNGQRLKITDRQITNIADMYRDGIPEAGLKTSTLMQNVTDRALNRFNPFTVQDVHMARAFGWRRKEYNKEGKLYDDAKIPGDLQYRYAQFLTNVLAKEFDLNPQQAQAVIWFAYKRAMGQKGGKPGTWKSAFNFTKPERAVLERMATAGKFSRATPPTPALRQGPITPSNRIKTKKIGFSNFYQNDQIRELARNMAPVVLTSSKPGNDRGYGWPDSTPYMALTAHNRAVVKAITDESGQIPFVKEMGIPHEVTAAAGTYEGMEPSIMVRMLGGTDAQTAFVANILGDALLQDAAVTLKPNYQDGQIYGIILNRSDGTDFTEAELQEIAKATNPEKDPMGMNFSQIDGDALLFNDSRQYDDSVTYLLDEMFPEFSANLLAAMPAGIDVRPESFRQDGEYYSHEQYRQEAGKLGNKARFPLTQGLRERLNDSLYKPAWEQYQRTAANLGFRSESLAQPRLDPDIAESRAATSALRPDGRSSEGRWAHPEAGKTPRQGIVLSGKRKATAEDFSAVHYGKEGDLETLSGDRYGDGIKGAESARLRDANDPRIRKRVYFYIHAKGSPSKRKEFGLGDHVYTQRFGNILNSESPAMRELVSQVEESTSGMSDDAFYNGLDSAVIEAGYDGIAVPSMGMMVILNHDVPVDYLGTEQELVENDGYKRHYRDSAIRVGERRAREHGVVGGYDYSKKYEARQHDPGAVEKSVALNKSDEEAAGRAKQEPYYSTAASPEAQHIARNPDAAIREGQYDIADAMRRPTYSTRGGAAINRAVNRPPPKRHPMEPYNNATGAVDTPSKLNYYLTKTKQAAVNRYARLEALNWSTELRENLADASSIAAALHAERAMGISAAAIKYGVPVYHNGWVMVVNQEMADDLAKRGNPLDIPGLDLSRVKSLVEVNAPLYSQEYGDLTEMAQAYAVAQRGYRLLDDGKKNPINRAEIADIEAEASMFVDHATGENIIERWWNDWQFYNEQVITMMEKAGVLKDETANLWREMADYFPFYRIAEGSEAEQFSLGQPVFGGMTGAIHLKKLKGKEVPVNMEMTEAMAMNLSAAIQMSMKNIAQQRIVRDMVQLGLAEEWQPGTQTNADIVEFRVNGDLRQYKIYDPLIYQSMKPLDGTDLVQMIRKTFGAPATFLREAVTRDPGFMLVNLLRDSLSSYGTSGARLKPLVSTFKGLFDGVETLEMMGVVGGYDYSNDPDNMVKFWDKTLRREGINRGGDMTALNLFKRAWDASVARPWDALGRGTTASDAATRNAVFDDVYARTGNYAEAAFQAMEVINFGRRGKNPIVRAIASMIPFLNARFQGLDVFWRAYTGRYTANKEANRRQVIMSALARGSLLLSGTVAYYLLVSDDDQYKEAPDFLKDNNWLIPTPWGVPVTIPIPFEVGLIFKTVPETLLARHFAGTEGLDLSATSIVERSGNNRDIRSGREAKETLQRGITSTLEISPFQIQFAGPIMEAVTNYNSFTGRQVVPQYLMDTREKGMQSEVYTNEAAKWLGEKMNISPMKLQHIAEGYAGTMGTYLFDLLDVGLKSEKLRGDNRNVMPTRPYYDYPIIKRFFGKENDKGLQQDAYDLYREVEKVNSTFKDMQKDGRYEEALAYLKNREILMGMRGSMGSVKRQLDLLRKRRNLILQSDLPPDMKRHQIDQLETAMNELLGEVVPVLKNAADLSFFEPLYYDD